MATRTVRLDDEAEAALAYICRRTGLEVSKVLKLAIRSFQDRPINQNALRCAKGDPQETASMILIDTIPAIALFDPGTDPVEIVRAFSQLL